MTTEQLVLCPFCGGIAERFICEETDNKGGDVIGCKLCLASTKVFFGEKVGIIESWNTRATTPRELALARAVKDMKPWVIGKAYTEGNLSEHADTIAEAERIVEEADPSNHP